MNAGKLKREAIQGWVANRFYYQVSIPVKDAAVLANCPDRSASRALSSGRSGVLPGVRYYVNFARQASRQEVACSSLTELFAPTIHRQRLDGRPQHYPWIEPEGYAYFRKRLSEARRDLEHGLAITFDHFRTRDERERALAAQFRFFPAIRAR